MFCVHLNYWGLSVISRDLIERKKCRCCEIKELECLCNALCTVQKKENNMQNYMGTTPVVTVRQMESPNYLRQPGQACSGANRLRGFHGSHNVVSALILGSEDKNLS